MTNSSELFHKLSKGLIPLYDEQEAQSLALWLMEEYLGLSRMQVLQGVTIENLPDELSAAWMQLKTGKPIQYILGKAPFYGRTFLVNEHTLIPRNETEELVHLILKENKRSGLKLLDIGTGTGCIPISLALDLEDAEVFGLDVSEAALAVARENAKFHDVEVEFLKVDILTSLPELTDLDILVSNPPYIPEAEKASMHQNVLEYEPSMALFVPDHDPLLFYRTIAEKGKLLLKAQGKIYFESHENYGDEVMNLLNELGYSELRLLKDLNGKDRIVVGAK